MEREKILIVEDDLITSRIIKRILENKGYGISAIVDTSDKILSSIEENRPDLILMDIVIKGETNGIESARIIKDRYEIPVIYLTSDSSDQTIERAKHTEPFGYLIKPLNEKILLTTIELAIQKQNFHNKKILETLRQANDELEKRVKDRTQELEKANEELKKEIWHRQLAEENLKKSERLAMIGKMSAVLAHEIRNPLNSIKINTDILSEVQALSDNNKRRIEIIQKEVNRLDALVKEVLMFSRQSTPVLSTFNLKSFLDGIISQIKPKEEQSQVEINNEAADMEIKGDVEKLKQVFLNIIINAAEAVPENGIIRIKSEIADERIEILVIDNGYGVEYPDRVFEPFFTTKSMGTGLGLAVSQNIIEHHKGQLYIKSSKPGETIFCISLPIK